MNIETFRKIILLNELGGKETLIYRFSPPASEKSGWTFGLCQFDVRNNHEAVQCLQNCGFSPREIAQIVHGEGDIKSLSSKLIPSIVDIWDNLQLSRCMDKAKYLPNALGISVVSEETLYHLADYHNQYSISHHGPMEEFLLSLDRPVTPKDIMYFKLNTLWGRKRPDDVERRWNNIHNLLNK